MHSLGCRLDDPECSNEASHAGRFISHVLLAGVQESNTSDRFGFDPDMYRSSMRLNQFRAPDVETDKLRNALRDEQERVRASATLLRIFQSPIFYQNLLRSHHLATILQSLQLLIKACQLPWKHKMCKRQGSGHK